MLDTPHKRVYTCWMLIEPADDIDGLWVAHCLNFDVISQGDDPVSAFESLREAVEMTVLDDLANGLDPVERAAPEEEWNKLARVLQTGTPTNFEAASKSGKKLILVVSDTFVVERIAEQPAMSPMFDIPPDATTISSYAA